MRLDTLVFTSLFAKRLSDTAVSQRALAPLQAAEEQEAAEAATDLVIRLGLAAFAVSAYIKTVLCPSMSSYTPRMSSASLVIPPSLQPLGLLTSQQHDLRHQS